MDALVIGAGPAGLMVAEQLALAGWRVVVAEAKPSPARKFLMAGKSGLNLTKDQPSGPFAAQYAEAADWLSPMLNTFGPDNVRRWAEGLGQPLFTGSSGRVFPVAMKASPLLRAWLARLDTLGVTLRTRWHWRGFQGEALLFDTPAGQVPLHAERTILALGGASWVRLGSDGAWVPWLREKGVEVRDWQPANMGFRVNWSPQMARHFGTPVKGAALCVAGRRERGEWIISVRGIEGGGIYAISRCLREGAALTIDLMPELSEAEIVARLARGKKGESLSNRLRKLGLPPISIALLFESGTPPAGPDALARSIKAVPLRHDGPRPLDEAISVAGGITRDALTPDLELRNMPGIYACGEMLDWEAPTGGYLLTACLATGRWAGRAAAGLSP
ncbi:MAG: aminoacetone oxidase family FAD-binding enzyme [Cereibacter sphaeroides]|uniref:Aminoacetone oxidase family FAD-binding enzyme n=1 Tax=Cereibacter sphaeroides TaxID=1063 RepID=A0A2W5RXS5_CERSP|nr:MAG: aminoacetone oxidase family FAD-binding enzyme [Cereibacter sphaeroides]